MESRGFSLEGSMTQGCSVAIMVWEQEVDVGLSREVPKHATST